MIVVSFQRRRNQSSVYTTLLLWCFLFRAIAQRRMPASPTSTTDDEATTATASSSMRRREALFLGDTEAFAFDFGGAAVNLEAEAEAEEVRQAALKSSELECAVAAVTGAEAGVRPLLAAEVKTCATAALRRGVAEFLGPRSRAGVRLTLEESVTHFKEGLRRYDASLWWADKMKREEKKKKERTKRARQ